MLGSSPLIETDSVNIIPARRFTPDDILLVGLKFHEADGTLAFDGFAVAGGVVFGFGLYAADGGSLVDFVEFLSGQFSQRLGQENKKKLSGSSRSIRMRVGIGDGRGL